MKISNSMTRRDLFTRWFGGSARAATRGTRAPDPSLLPGYLRPPGALPEAELISVCERCHKCRDACPHEVILPLGPAYGDADGTPAILPRGGACRMCEDLPCVAACPSGGLRPLPLSDVRLGTARLDPSLCWAAKGQPCDYCVDECPLGEKALRWNGSRPEVVADGCTGCGQCVHICTADPAALSIVPHQAT